MDEIPSDALWRDWLDEQAGRLLLFARQQTRSAADAEDVLQEAVVEAWQRAGSDAPPPLPLVYATIRRRAIDLARKDDRRRRREEAADAGEATWFDPGFAESENRELLEAAMKTLPQMHREALVLKIWGGLTFEEIGRVLDIPANTAASRYRYGLEGMRKRLEACGR
jgi:RNA polymerase sigma-70 factor (ECF subfamily)